MNPLNAMSLLHRRYCNFAPYREIAQRLAIMVVLIYFGAILSAEVVEFVLGSPGEIEHFITWISPPELPPEWQWPSRLMRAQTPLCDWHPPRRFDWIHDLELFWS